jgi:chromosome segregation ATPase
MRCVASFECGFRCRVLLLTLTFTLLLQVKTLTNEINKLSAEREKQRDRITDLETQLASERVTARALADEQSKNATLAHRLAEAENNAASLQRARTALEAAIKARTAELTESNTALKELQTKHTVLKTEYKNASDELAVLKAGYDSLVTQLKESTGAKIAEARAVWENLHTKKIKELEAKMKKEYDTELVTLRERSSSMQDTSARFRSDLAKTASDLASAQDLASTTLKKLSELETRHQADSLRWTDEKARLESALADEIGKRMRKEDDYAKIAAANISLQSEIEHYA